jgi:hypothetical protein
VISLVQQTESRPVWMLEYNDSTFTNYVILQVLDGYLKFMTDLGFLLHGVQNRTVVESLMQKVLDFEMQMAEVS